MVEAVRAAVVEHHGDSEAPTLSVVAITDGAKHIRSHLERAFGGPIPVISEWCHPTKKAYQLLSMVAHGKDERERMQQEVVGFLWRGEVRKALSYLREVSARRVEALRELVTYLQRRASEIIDYERRAKAGKSIGSGSDGEGCRTGYRAWSEEEGDELE